VTFFGRIRNPRRQLGGANSSEAVSFGAAEDSGTFVRTDDQPKRANGCARPVGGVGDDNLYAARLSVTIGKWRSPACVNRGQLRGSGREWDRAILAIESLPQKDGTEEVGDSITL